MLCMGGKQFMGEALGKRVLLGMGVVKKVKRVGQSEQAVSSGFRLGRHSISSFLIVELQILYNLSQSDSMDVQKEKQDYLYRQIIEQNYDPEEFQKVMEEHKGFALQDYTLQELMKIVKEFKNRCEGIEETEEEEGDRNSRFSYEEKMEDSGQVQNQIVRQKGQEQPNIQNINTSFNSANKVYRHLVKKQSTSLIYKKIHEKNQSINIHINSYMKKQQSSLFSHNYITYLIQTHQCGWYVYRRFKDFEWLQGKLTQLLPGYPIPPIAKKTKMRRFDSNHIENRMKVFQQYLNKLLNIPQICSEQIFEDFISVSDQHEFQKCKSKFEQKLKVRDNLMATLKGEDSIDKTAFKVDAGELQYYKKKRQILHKVNSGIFDLQKSLRQSQQSSLQLESSLNELHTHMQNKSSVKGGDVVDLQADFIRQIGAKIQRQQFYLSKYIQNYWYYEEMYVDKLVNSIQTISREEGYMLNRYKNMAYYELDPQMQENSRQGKMFEEYQQIREVFRLKLSFLREEIERYESADMMRYCRGWTDKLSQYMDEVKNDILKGVDQVTKGMCINEGRKMVEVEYISKMPKQLMMQMKQE